MLVQEPTGIRGRLRRVQWGTVDYNSRLPSPERRSAGRGLCGGAWGGAGPTGCSTSLRVQWDVTVGTDEYQEAIRVVLSRCLLFFGHMLSCVCLSCWLWYCQHGSDAPGKSSGVLDLLQCCNTL